MQKGMTMMLVVLYAAGLTAAFNENIINVVLLDVMNEFDVSSITANWLVTGYMIVTTIIVALMAYLQSRFQAKNLLLFGACVFTIGSLGAFFAQKFAILLVFRLVQAVGSGVFITLMMTNVLAIAPKEKLGSYLAIGSCCITLGPALAPVISGAMATSFSWRFVFVAPTIVIVCTAIAACFFMKNMGETHSERVDASSIILATVGLTSFVYGLSEIMNSPLLGIILLVLGAALLFVFVKRQNKLEKPLLSLHPFRQKKFVFACILAVVAMITTFSMSVLLMLYFEGALCMNAFTAGALLLIPILINALTAMLGGRIMDKRGPWPLLPLGFALILLGQVCVAVFSYAGGLWSVVFASTISYAGVGFVFSPAQTAGLSSTAPHEHASGVSLMNLFIQIAACIGPALLVGIYSSIAANSRALNFAETTCQAYGFAAAVLAECLIVAIGILVAFKLARMFSLPTRHSQKVQYERVPL